MFDEKESGAFYDDVSDEVVRGPGLKTCGFDRRR